MRHSSLLSINQQASTLHGAGSSPRTYTPYGYLASKDGPLICFTGQLRDITHGLYHLGNGHRVYQPQLMRFLSPDRLSPFGLGGMNAYAYCNGDPITRTDPSGRVWQPVVGAISSSVTGIGAIARTLKNEALRLQHNHLVAQGLPSTYTEPPLLSRVGNTMFAATSVSGVAGNLLSGVEGGWADSSLLTLSSGFGMANSVGNISGGLTSNFGAAQEAWRLMGQPGIPSSSVVFGAFVEVTGIRMAGEALALVGRKSMELADRVTHAARDAYASWSSWPRPTRSNIELNNFRNTGARENAPEYR